jgi:hypothetical protein
LVGADGYKYDSSIVTITVTTLIVVEETAIEKKKFNIAPYIEDQLEFPVKI